jgi:hypothetical protein
MKPIKVGTADTGNTGAIRVVETAGGFDAFLYMEIGNSPRVLIASGSTVREALGAAYQFLSAAAAAVLVAR